MTKEQPNILQRSLWNTIAVAFVFGLTLVSCKTNEPLLPEGFAGDYLRLGFGGAFSDNRTYILTRSEIARQDLIAKHGRSFRFDRADPVRNALSANEAEEVWSSVESLQFKKWKPDYRPEEFGILVNGGLQWHLEIRKGSKVQTIQGDNAYPALNPIGAPTMNEKQNAFLKLQQILDAALEETPEEDGSTT